jgi:hypothetical protein
MVVEPAGGQGVRLPTGETPVAGSIEVINRWKTSGGNQDLYRSLVDLGAGPKLENFELRYRETADGSRSPFLDTADIRLTSWGGEPTSTLSAEWSLGNDYEASIKYRRFAYFNRIPSVSNPTPGFTGATQQWLDIDRGLFDAELTIQPRSRIVPFFAVSRDSGKGPGRTTFVEDANEYSVLSATDTYTNTFRGGLRLRFERWTATIEGGTSAFDDSGSVQFSGDTTGNRAALFFGRRLRLTDLDQSYKIRGSNRFASVRLEARPWSKLAVFGQFAFSQPAVTVSYSESSAGESVLLQRLAFYTGESAIGVGQSKRPMPTGNFGFEYRPTRRIRIVESLSFEQFHASGSSQTTRELTGGQPLELTDGGTGRLESNLARNRFDITFELSRALAMHASHTYLTADATSPGSLLVPAESRTFTRHTTTAGLTVRVTDKLEFRSDLELLRGDNVYFRTDQRRYGRVVLRGRYRVSDTLTATVYGSIWNNTNELSDSTRVDDNLVQRNRHIGGELVYAPGVGWLDAVHATYERSTFSSNVGFLIPQSFQAGTSAYRERGHSSTLGAVFRPQSKIELGLGGNLFVSTDTTNSGLQTRPTRFYNSHMRVSVELISRLNWNGEWRWYEYANRSLRGEAFGTHLISTGLTYTF